MTRATSTSRVTVSNKTRGKGKAGEDGAAAANSARGSTVRRNAKEAGGARRDERTAQYSDADLEPIRIHDVRHTAATLMLLAGINVKVVSERLGHASVAITLQTYAHVLPSMQEDAAVKLEALLRGRPAATAGA